MKSAANYVPEIKKYHAELQDYPDSTTLQKKLDYRLGKWASLLDIVIRVAANEQIPWTDAELGCVTIPMAKKAETGFDQTGDYHFEILIDDQSIIPGGLIIERKTIPDLYGTLMRSDSRQRFYREIGRFTADVRHDTMVVMVEGTYQEFLAFKPKFNGLKFNRNNFGASVESRRATVAGLYARGIPVQWCGTRHQAILLYQQMLRQWCIKNYKKIIMW